MITYRQMIQNRGAISVPPQLDLPYLKYYQESPLDTQLFAMSKYGDYILDIDTEDLQEALQYYDGMYQGLFFYNDYKYRTMYNTIIQNYNPIENYDRIEETTVNGENTNKVNGKTSTQSTANVNGNTTSNTNNPGITQNIGGVSVDTTEQTTTFDDIGFKDKSHIENVTGSQINTTSYDKDTISQSESSNVTKFDEVKLNEDATNGTSKIVTTSRIHGNVGVTTSAQMLSAERQLALFSFYEVIIKDFIEVACKLVY